MPLLNSLLAPYEISTLCAALACWSAWKLRSQAVFASLAILLAATVARDLLCLSATITHADYRLLWTPTLPFLLAAQIGAAHASFAAIAKRASYLFWIPLTAAAAVLAVLALPFGNSGLFTATLMARSLEEWLCLALAFILAVAAVPNPEKARLRNDPLSLAVLFASSSAQNAFFARKLIGWYGSPAPSIRTGL